MNLDRPENTEMDDRAEAGGVDQVGSERRPAVVMHILGTLETGGMENGVVNLVNGLDRQRFRPVVCCLEGEGELRARIKDDVKVVNLMQGPGLRYGLPFRLSRLFRREEVAIVHTHNFFSAVYGVLGAKLARTPVVIHGEHGMELHRSPRQNMVTGFLCKLMDAMTTVSDALKDRLQGEVKIGKVPVTTIINGVDLDRFGIVDSEAGRAAISCLESGDRVLGTVGRLVAVKDNRSMIEAFARVAAVIDGAKLIIVGDGPLKEDLARLVRELGLEGRVFLLGQRNDIHLVLGALDLFVLSSLSEGMSNVILEAMAARLPVIATKVGNNADLVEDGETGRLVPSADPDQLAEAMLELLSDPAKARNMGEQGRLVIESNYGLDSMVAEYEALYEHWLGAKGWC